MRQLLTERLLTLSRLALPLLISYVVVSTVRKIPYLEHYPVTSTLLIGVTTFELYRYLKRKLFGLPADNSG
ncbi:MAG TPA: hypothetical protein VFV52_12350 [Bacilli bacterium]|nr:hypothetical protein [Bacilli bacterium]